MASKDGWCRNLYQDTFCNIYSKWKRSTDSAILSLDVIKNSAKLRFNQEGLLIMKWIEAFLLNAANKVHWKLNDLMKALINFSEIIDLQELTSEAQEFPSYIKLYNKNIATVLNFAKIWTIRDVLNSISGSKECLPWLHKLLKLYLSVPLWSVSAERTFSAMRWVKNWLRSTMLANGLNHTILAACSNNVWTMLMYPT